MSINKINPFPTTGYLGKDYFCDRESELFTLRRQVENKMNTTLISLRRMGKSALIHRLFDDLSSEKSYYCIYTDIYSTQNLKELTENLSQAIIQQVPEHKSLIKRFIELLKGFHPTITYDALTGQPEVSFEFQEIKMAEKTLNGIFQFLENQDKPVILAIDEFQQVANYPEKNTEAILRSHIQQLKNIQFIFSGSNKHMMVELFNNAKRPFFSSTQLMYLNPISEDKYGSFIKNKFDQAGKKIEDEAVHFILQWTRLHTYYTQVICNNTFSLPQKNITEEAVKLLCNNILSSQQATYIQFRQLLSPVQWQLLIAIAKEGKVFQPQSKSFIQRYKIGTPANSKRALDALLEKEMIYREDDLQASSYQVYDIFLSRWLALTF